MTTDCICGACRDRQKREAEGVARQIARERIVGAAVAFIEHGSRERRQELAEAVEALRRLEHAPSGEGK